jgi:hypothetical protein
MGLSLGLLAVGTNHFANFRDLREEFACQGASGRSRMISRQEGLRQINDNAWQKDEYGALNQYVHAPDERLVHAFLLLRPHCCDRGQTLIGILSLWRPRWIHASSCHS